MNRRERRADAREARKQETLIRHRLPVIGYKSGALAFAAYFTKSRKKVRR